MLFKPQLPSFVAYPPPNLPCSKKHNQSVVLRNVVYYSSLFLEHPIDERMRHECQWKIHKASQTVYRVIKKLKMDLACVFFHETNKQGNPIFHMPI